MTTGGLPWTEADLVAHIEPENVAEPAPSLRAAHRVGAGASARGCLASLGRYWGAVSAQTEPDHDLDQVDFAGIRSLSLLLYDHLLEAGGVVSQH